MKITLQPGEALAIAFEGTDGIVEVHWGTDSLTISTDMPDTAGRTGIIYEEVFGAGMLNGVKCQHAVKTPLGGTGGDSWRCEGCGLILKDPA